MSDHIKGTINFSVWLSLHSASIPPPLPSLHPPWVSWRLSNLASSPWVINKPVTWLVGEPGSGLSFFFSLAYIQALSLSVITTKIQICRLQYENTRNTTCAEAVLPVQVSPDWLMIKINPLWLQHHYLILKCFQLSKRPIEDPSPSTVPAVRYWILTHERSWLCKIYWIRTGKLVAHRI